MAQKQVIDAMWDDSPIDVSTEVNFIWSIANKLRGTYQSDKYKDVIIPMVIIRRFECALEPTKDKVVAQFKANPNYPAKAMYRISGFQFYNTSEFDLAELVNDADHLAATVFAGDENAPRDEEGAKYRIASGFKKEKIKTETIPICNDAKIEREPDKTRKGD